MARTNNNNKAGTTEGSSSAAAAALTKVHKVYGPSANIYADVLKVSPDANPSEIREAFFCLRYDIYQKLGNGASSDGGGGAGGGGGGELMTPKERREVEARLDAITGAFHIVSDASRRKAYDSSSSSSTTPPASANNATTATTTANTNERRSIRGSFPAAASTKRLGQGRSNSDATAKTTNSAASSSSSPPSSSSPSSSSPTKLSPSKADSDPTSTNNAAGGRRSVFRRRARRAASNHPPAGPPGKVSGMNASRRAVAKPVMGGLNARRDARHRNVESSDTIFDEVPSEDGGLRGEKQDTADAAERKDGAFDSLANTGSAKDSIFGSADQTESWTDFGNMNGNENDDSNGQGRGQPPLQGSGSNVAGSWQDNIQQPLPAGVNNLNAREQMLYKNQMYITQQKQQHMMMNSMQQQQQQQYNNTHNEQQRRGRPSRLGSKYDTQERGDKYAEGGGGDKYDAVHETNSEAPDAPGDLVSPTGVDAFDDANNVGWSRKSVDNDESNKETIANRGRYGNNNHRGRQADRPPSTSTTDSNVTGDSNAQEVLAPSSEQQTNEAPGRNRNDETDDEMTFGEDDTQTYGDETTTLDGDTLTYDEDDTQTYGDDDTQTYGDDTATQMEDSTIGEQSTYASEFDEDDTYATNNSGGGRYSPGHKKGKTPQPILRRTSSSGAAVKKVDSDKRVTIHSHRGRGEDNDDLSLFDSASCPAMPSFASLQEEVSGTYKDFTQALHQVSNAFVINSDDIDRIADKIRDAKIELGETYHKQLNERSSVGDNKAL